MLEQSQIKLPFRPPFCNIIAKLHSVEMRRFTPRRRRLSPPSQQSRQGHLFLKEVGRERTKEAQRERTTFLTQREATHCQQPLPLKIQSNLSTAAADAGLSLSPIKERLGCTVHEYEGTTQACFARRYRTSWKDRCRG